MTEELLSMWTVYDHPKDFPDSFVARRWVIKAGHYYPTEDILTAPTLDELRQLIPPQFARIDRHPTDDANIVEVWL